METNLSRLTGNELADVTAILHRHRELIGREILDKVNAYPCAKPGQCTERALQEISYLVEGWSSDSLLYLSDPSYGMQVLDLQYLYQAFDELGDLELTADYNGLHPIDVWTSNSIDMLCDTMALDYLVYASYALELQESQRVEPVVSELTACMDYYTGIL